MRIERLVLERYGHFTARELDLSDRATRLFVVCGNNEAGKTTALNAIGDLLFGIDARSPYAFLHGYADMRIGGEISARDGATLGFKRRKGQKNTLLAADDRPLADEALKPFLGDADRELFLRLFGLTHQSLASGAAAMLDAKGDVGQVLFEAGGSIRRLVQVRRGLDEEASQLFTPRRASSKKLYTALDVYDQARSELRRLSITPDDFRRASDELAAARAELGATYARLKALQTERARNERIRRLLPGLANLTQDRKDLAALADAADLPADAGDRVARAHEQMRLATAAAEREERAAAEAIGELEGLCLPEALLARADDIRLMHERRGAILKARDDLPNRRAERHQLAGELERLARDLGTSIDGAAALARLPAATARATLRRLIAQASAVETERRTAQARVTEAAAEHARVAARLAATAATEPAAAIAALRRGYGEILAKGDLEAARFAAREAEQAALTRLDQALSGLPGWHGDADALASLQVPDAATLSCFEAELTAVQDTRRRLRECQGETLAAARSHERQLAEVQALGEVPTTAALAQARRLRDQGWRLIRRRHLAGEAVTDAEIAAFAPGAGLADAYERAVLTADHLADSRATEADRVARHAAAAAALTEASAELARLDSELTAAQAELATVRANWTRVWAPLGIGDPGSPREMQAWLGQRLAALREYQTWQDAARLHAAADRACSAATRLLAQLAEPLSLAISADDGLTGVMVRIAEFLAVAGMRAEERQRLEERALDLDVAVERERQRLVAAEASSHDWDTAWRTATIAAGLAAGADVGAAEKALDLWETIGTVGVRLADLDERITGIEADIAAFTAGVRALVGEVAVAIDPRDPLQAALEAFTRLQAAEAARNRHETLVKARDQACKRADEARAREAEARDTVHHFIALTGCTSEDKLADAVQRARRKAELRQRIEAATAGITAAADGLTLAQAEAEAVGRDADALKADIDAAEGEIDGLLETAQRLGAAIQEKQSQQAALSTGEGAVASAQAMADAQADLEACARRWMLLRTAAFILHGGIERFRTEHQGPLLQAGGAIFRTLTLGSFAGFRIDYDERDMPKLVGERPGGSVCAIEAMSDGTRDQLFLALRIAAVESYAEAAEPLPFIADDLFVNFDDARAAAGIDALIGLGTATQVLLFTHHRHLAELARGRPGVRIVDLERP